METVTVNGVKYKLVEDLGFVRGKHQKVVSTPDGERIVSFTLDRWRWASKEDMMIHYYMTEGYKYQ